MPSYQGVKLCADEEAVTTFHDLARVEVVRQCGEILVERPGVIGAGSWFGGGNSGFQALNLAAQFGSGRIVLVGFDMRLDLGTHWHGPHRGGLNNPSAANLAPWRRALDGAGAALATLGVTVVNASTISTLTAYPVRPLPEALT